MKRTALLIFSSLLLIVAQAQSGGGRLPRAAARDTSRTNGIREKLVQLAMQNPTYEVADRNINLAYNDLEKTKLLFLNHFVVQGNYNEFSNRKDANGLVYYPRYNAGVTVPFDIFVTRKRDLNISKEKLGIAQAEKNQKYREIRQEILTKYEDYLLLKSKLEFASQITQDAYTFYLQAEKDFADGILKQAEYSTAYRSWVDEQIRKIDAQHDFNVKKLEIETLIGIPIDEVIAQYK